jgi:ribosome-interacting GTPase 1
MLNKIGALSTIADDKLPKDILKYKTELASLYNNLFKESVSLDDIQTVVSSDLAQYEDAIKTKKKTRLTEEQYNTLSKAFNDLESVLAQRETILNDEVSDITKKLTGFEKVNITRNFSKALIGTAFYALGAIFAALGLFSIDNDEDYMGVVLDVAG